MKKNNSLYILAPYVAVGFKSNVLNLGYGSLNTKIVDSDLQYAVLVTCAFFKKPREIMEIFTLPFKENVLLKVLSILTSNTYLINYDNYDNIPEIHNRLALNIMSQGYTYDEYINSIKSKKIAIIGCGAIGTSMAISLVTNGIENLTLVDNDNYSYQNMFRSNHINKEMIGNNKSKALKEVILSKNNSCNINIIDKKINKNDTNLSIDADFIILSADSIYLLKTINSYSIKNNIPFIQVGYAHDWAVWGPIVIPKKSGCIECRCSLVTESDEDTKKLISIINSGYTAPATSYLVEFAVSNAVKDILDYFITGKSRSIGKKIGISMNNSERIETEYNRNPNCFCFKK